MSQREPGSVPVIAVRGLAKGCGQGEARATALAGVN